MHDDRVDYIRVADASTDTSADAITDASTNACAYAGDIPVHTGSRIKLHKLQRESSYARVLLQPGSSCTSLRK
jgi:hypothetical protein